MVYLPDAKFGVVDDIVSHGELRLVLWRINRLDLSNNAALRFKNLAVLLRHVGQHGDDKRVFRLSLPQALGQAHHAFHVVSIACQEGHVRHLGSGQSLLLPIESCRRHGEIASRLRTETRQVKENVAEIKEVWQSVGGFFFLSGVLKV